MAGDTRETRTFMKSEPRVFVVVDDRLVRVRIGDVLTREGYDVEKFASAADYLAHTPYLRPICIVLEAELPGFDSLAFLSIGSQSSRRLVGWLAPKLPTKNIIFGMALDPQELQKMLDELAASRASRRTAWTILQELRAVLKDVAGVELPPPAVKNISIEGRMW
jgi:CheY-like chemotaxis protein